MTSAGAYIHIPFCERKCPYCDFVSFVGRSASYTRYIEALLSELDNRRSQWQHPFDTLFVGGGTPTILSSEQLEALIISCRRKLFLPKEAEITVEANPGTIDAELLDSLRRAGVTRLSLGVQSFDDQELVFLGRIHDRKRALIAYEMARAAGFENINLDLIFGLPEQPLSNWQNSLEQSLALSPEHLSLYALTLSGETPMGRRVASGNLPAPDEDAVARMYEEAEVLLGKADYTHYEISNWARGSSGKSEKDLPNHACRHNIHYWRNEPYLGLGAAAHSYDGVVRSANLEDLDAYMERIEEGRSPTEFRETLNAERRMDETMMLGLRMLEGVTWQEFQSQFGRSLCSIYAEQIDEMVTQGLLVADDVGIRLSKRGRLLGNRVFAAFLR